MAKKTLIDESLKEKKSELFEIDGNMFRVNYLPKAGLNRLEAWVNKLSSGDARAMHLKYATDINHSGKMPTEFVDAVEAAEKYIDFIKVCTLYNNREMMEEALRSAPKKKDGTLTGRRVQHLAFTGLAVDFNFYELCAVNETDNVMLIEIRSTDCSHKYLPAYESSRSCQEIINKNAHLLPNSIKEVVTNIQKTVKKTATMPSEIKKQFKIEKNDDGFTVSKYKGDDENVVVPDYIGNTPVTVVGAGAFVTIIDGNYFAPPRKKIKYVVIPNTVKKIENSAFAHCWNLSNIVLPDNIKSIGQYTFLGCSSLTEVKLPAALKKITQCMFMDCKNLLSITIPDGVTDIRYCAFANNANLSKVVIPNSVKDIHREAFSGCEKIVIYAKSGSYAEKYAEEQNIEFIAI